MRPSWAAQKGSRDNVPCGVKGRGSLVGFGATPQLFHGRPFQRKSQQRRRQRSVPASNFALPQERPPTCFPNNLHIVAPNGATDQHREKRSSLCAGLSRCRGISPLRRRQGGNENRRMSAVAPSTPSACTLPCLDFLITGGTAPAGVNSGVPPFSAPLLHKRPK